MDSRLSTTRKYRCFQSACFSCRRLASSDITFEEYEAFTHGNIVRAAKEITSGRQLRIYVDTLIRQVMSDLKDQKDVVDAAFQRRTHELKHAKLKLETQHSEVI